MTRPPIGNCRYTLRSALLCASILGALPLGANAQEAFQLGTIVLTASGYEQLLADAPATISVITEEDIEGRGYNTVTDILQTTPGLIVENGGKTNSPSISMRGLGENYVLMLVDGKPLGSTQEAFYNGWGSGQKTAALPPASSIERIEVIRGPMSSLYGSSASGGVINVITKPVPTEWSGRVSLETSVAQNPNEGDSRTSSFYLSGPLSQTLGLTLFGSYFSRDPDTIASGSADIERRTLGARLNWQIANNQDLAFEFSATDQDHETTVATTGADGQVHSRTDTYGATHNILWGAGFDTTSFITYEQIKIDNATLVSSYNVWNANTKTTRSFGDHMVTVGADFKYENTTHDPTRFAGSVATDLTRWHVSLFAEDDWQITDQFALTLGGRYDLNQHYGSHFTPRVYGVYHLNDTLTLKGGVSGGYTVPALKQADTNIVEPAGRGAGWDRGNSALLPETSTNYELGMVWETYNGMQLGATAYHTRFRNKIDREYICFSAGACTYNGQTRDWIQQYVNRGTATLSGLELTLDVPVGPVDFSANYTYQYSMITSGANAGTAFNDLPAHMLNLRADWAATDNLSVWGAVRYRGPTTRQERSGPVPTPAYTLADVGFKYDVNDNLQAYGGVTNVFNKALDSATYGQVQDGRRIFVGLASSF
ncbi:MAG: TonB-dependent receptor [Pseudomonadota bacterium]|nr:TonB-dependent receptor [Pseudomonadota bacterium]